MCEGTQDAGVVNNTFRKIREDIGLHYVKS